MNFVQGTWNEKIDVRDFIVKNYTPYEGDESFLAPATEKTKKLWGKVLELMKKEREAGGVLDIDEKTISSITSHAPGYVDKDLEEIVGLQTDEPLKRAIMPFGGIRMVHTSLEAYGRKLPEEIDT
ncbi:MAG TPA: pyruvate formate lyase family protein, partial [Oscillospiraceae bacterium]|nr:pyruvate formate lyase family protein [Oscillospiraceae bacterium]